MHWKIEIDQNSAKICSLQCEEVESPRELADHMVQSSVNSRSIAWVLFVFCVFLMYVLQNWQSGILSWPLCFAFGLEVWASSSSDSEPMPEDMDEMSATQTSSEGAAWIVIRIDMLDFFWVVLSCLRPFLDKNEGLTACSDPKCSPRSLVHDGSWWLFSALWHLALVVLGIFFGATMEFLALLIFRQTPQALVGLSKPYVLWLSFVECSKYRSVNHGFGTSSYLVKIIKVPLGTAHALNHGRTAHAGIWQIVWPSPDAPESPSSPSLSPMPQWIGIRCEIFHNKTWWDHRLASGRPTHISCHYMYEASTGQKTASAGILDCCQFSWARFARSLKSFNQIPEVEVLCSFV